MKILVVCQFYYPEQFRINDICETLAKLGNDVTVLTGLPNYPNGIVPREYKFFRKRKEKVKNVNIIRCFEIGRRKGTLWRILNYISFTFSASVKALFLKKDFDTIFVYQLSPITMAIPAIIYKKKCKNKKLHLYCLDLWPESLLVDNFSKDSKIYKIIYKLSKWVYQKCDSITVTSRGFIDYFKNELNIEKEIRYLPQYCEENFYFQNINNSEKEEKNINLVFTGNIGKAQSVETIIKAVDKLNDDNVYVHIIGDGSLLEKCKELTQKLNLKNIIFYGRKPIEEMGKYYNMADAMLITLANEGVISKTIPGKLQSYMATGKPILGAIGGETNEIIKNAKCGYCTNAEDYSGLADIIKKFSNDSKEERRKMALNSYNYYKENFRKEKFIENLLKIIKEEK